MIGINISGMERLKRAMVNKEKDLITGVDLEMEESIIEINRNQKALVPVGKTKSAAPVDFGPLKSSLKFDVSKKLDKQIVSTGPGSSYAPYQEFGTGGLVSIPAGLEQEAAKFKGRGLRKVNMKAQPFFFGPLFMEKPKLIKRLEQLFKR